MTGYRDDYNVSSVVDVNNDTCQEVTAPKSNTAFRLEIELRSSYDNLTLTLVMTGGICLHFPATMVYTLGDQAAILPYSQNPSFCDNVQNECLFKCDCSVVRCQRVFLIILSARNVSRELCEFYIVGETNVSVV